MNLIGYARVSTTDQALDLQLDALDKAGAFKVFVDQASGATQERPGGRNARGICSLATCWWSTTSVG